jgi:hypothetical protein
MLQAIDEARFRTADPPDPDLLVVSTRVHTGKRGHPRIHIDETFLRAGLTQRGVTRLAPIFNCSARTVRRRALQAGLVRPGEPPFHIQQQDDGTVIHIQNPRSGRTRDPQLSDEDLDRKVFEILQQFPTFGRRMLDGRLQSAGYNITRKRLIAAYIRVNGIP